MYKYMLILHILSATVWTGGHLVLALTVLPKALERNDPQLLLEFDSAFERIGIPSLLLGVATGLWLAYQMIPDVPMWFAFKSNMSTLIVTKITLLALTVGLAVDARLRIAPTVSPDNMKKMVFHVILVTVISVLFVIMGVGFRTGGIF